MPRISITVKYSLLVLTAILLTSGLLSLIVLNLVRHEVREQLQRRGEAITQQLAYALAPVLLGKDDAKVGAALNNVLKEADIVAGSVLDADYSIVADSRPDLRGRAFAEASVPVRNNGCQGYVEDLERDRLVFMSSASFGGVRVGCVVIQISRASITGATEQATSRVLSLTALIALVVIVLSFLTLRRALKPLGKIVEGTRRISQGDFSTRLDISSKDEIGDLAQAFNGMAARTELFFRYVDKSIAERLVNDEDLVRPGGQLKQVSVLFGDMRQFTALSNRMAPDQVVRILNSYFDLFFQVVHHYSGVVDKTMGDAIMAFFEAFRTLDTTNPQRATLAAVSMRAAVWSLGETLRSAKEMGIPILLTPCQFGFSVATGRLIVGNIGSGRHMDYTVCGPPVNLASRLQQDTLQGEIIVDRFTAMDVDDLVVARELPRVRPKGFAPSQEVTPFQIIGVKAAEMAHLRQLLRRLFSSSYFLEHVLPSKSGGAPIPDANRQRWAEALVAFSAELIDGEQAGFLTG